jgi:ribonuclease BN (tRNA processing enzyme)
MSMHRTAKRTLGIAAVIGLAAMPAAAMAQSTGGAKSVPQAKVRLITLGTTAGPLPRKDRAQTANLLEVNGTPYLIDAGDGVARRLVQAGIDFTKIGRIFITHDHDDHTAGLPNLLDVEWQYNRRKPIVIYGPPGTEATVKGALAFDHVDEVIRMSETRATPLEKLVEAHDVGTGKIYQDDNIKVIAVENTHFQFPKGSPAYGKFKSYGYRFEMAGTTVVFTGDTGPSPAIDKLAKGADVLVSESLALDEIRARMQKAGRWDKMTPKEREGWNMHMHKEHITPAEAGEMAQRAGVKTLILSHLSASGADHDDYQRFVDAAAKHFSGRIIAAKDLMVFTP